MAAAYGLESFLQFGKETGHNHAAARIEYASGLLESKNLVVYDRASLCDRKSPKYRKSQLQIGGITGQESPPRCE